MFIINSSAIPESREKIKTILSLKLRKVLFEMRQIKFGQLHRCLPWTLVGAAHQRGAVNFYPTVRQRINEIVPDQLEYTKTTYVPDVTCFHFGELSHEADNAIYRLDDQIDFHLKSGINNKWNKKG